MKLVGLRLKNNLGYDVAHQISSQIDQEIMKDLLWASSNAVSSL